MGKKCPHVDIEPFMFFYPNEESVNEKMDQSVPDRNTEGENIHQVENLYNVSSGHLTLDMVLNPHPSPVRD